MAFCYVSKTETLPHDYFKGPHLFCAIGPQCYFQDKINKPPKAKECAQFCDKDSIGKANMEIGERVLIVDPWEPDLKPIWFKNYNFYHPNCKDSLYINAAKKLAIAPSDVNLTIEERKQKYLKELEKHYSDSKLHQQATPWQREHIQTLDTTKMTNTSACTPVVPGSAI